MFGQVRATADEQAITRPGDELVMPADVVKNRGFTVPVTPEQVWPWLLQLGKRRAGWYLPRRLEHAIPRRRRGIRHIDAQWQRLAVGDIIPDWGGRDATFQVAALEPGRFLVYTSQRGRVALTWSITLTPLSGPASPSDSARADHTRIHLRLRLAPVRHRWLAETGGELLDVLTVAGLAAGLRERLEESAGQIRG